MSVLTRLREGDPGSASPPPDELVHFVCNVCGAPCEVPRGQVRRETPSCATCGSTLRFRAVVSALSAHLYGESRVVTDFDGGAEVRGLGLSDWPGYAVPLEQRTGYVNTYYHQEPYLDIVEPGPLWDRDAFDFIVSSDVFEHVPPPASRAFRSCFELLRSGGLLVLTVPYGLGGPTREHFPQLHDFTVVELASGRVLVNRTADGTLQVFDDLVFHGGDGSTLEMRVFSQDDLLAELRAAGFVDVRVDRSGDPERGVFWDEPWSLPVLARKP